MSPMSSDALARRADIIPHAIMVPAGARNLHSFYPGSILPACAPYP